MRRRSRRTPNTSESTGKIGQELPSNQPAPLVPLYPDEVPALPPWELRSDPRNCAAPRSATTGRTGSGRDPSRQAGTNSKARGARKTGAARQAGME